MITLLSETSRGGAAHPCSEHLRVAEAWTTHPSESRAQASVSAKKDGPTPSSMLLYKQARLFLTLKSATGLYEVSTLHI